MRLLSPIQLFKAIKKIKLKHTKDAYVEVNVVVDFEGSITYVAYTNIPKPKLLESTDQQLLLKVYEDFLKSSVVDESIDRTNTAEW